MENELRGEELRSAQRMDGRGGGVLPRVRAQVLAFAGRALDESGQGTTEYAILVGVLVVIAIVAIVAFRGRVQELWTAIADGINSL